MYSESIKYCAINAKRIVDLKKENISFYISSAMAGAYVSLAMIFILTVGSSFDKSIQMLSMGITFGVSLTLVIIAGSELFTGHAMYLTFGIKSKIIKIQESLNVLIHTWLGNFLGAIIIVSLFLLTDSDLLKDQSSLVHSLALKKTQAGYISLFVKGMLCNYFVCLACWMCVRVKGTGKFIIIWWCLLCFVVSGYEHSVANMALFALSYLGNHSDHFTLAVIFKNLICVTFGNLFAGIVFMGFGYWYATPKKQRPDLLNYED